MERKEDRGEESMQVNNPLDGSRDKAHSYINLS